MSLLSIATIQLITWEKLLLFVSIAIFALLYGKKVKAVWYMVFATATICAFYVILVHGAQRMWWGSNGDELFVGAFLTRVMQGNLFADFYYPWLSVFYPPLYFWIVGSLAHLVGITNAISAAKLGVLMALMCWFTVPYFAQWGFWKNINPKDVPTYTIVRSTWFWLLVPVLMLITLNFDVVMLKPYETLSAVLTVLYMGLLAEYSNFDTWHWARYLFFGIAAGLLVLAYYFWWFIAALALLVFALMSRKRVQNIMRLGVVGVIALVITLPYLAPLIADMARYGIENWQAVYFVPQDLATFAPWGFASSSTLIALVGLVGLIAFARESKFVRINLIALVACYLYQLLGIFMILVGFKPLQMAKPFLFFGSAALMVGAAYALVWSAQWVKDNAGERAQHVVIIIVFVLAIVASPFVRFIDDPVAQAQIEQDRVASGKHMLAREIVTHVPEYERIIWLSSNAPDINLYLPINYYIAYNPHFSHPAVIYSARKAFVETLARARDAKEFQAIISRVHNPRITGLLFYYDKQTKSYPLFFWVDDYPNGGKEERIDIDPKLIDQAYWQLRFTDKAWYVYTKKNSS